MPDPEAGDFFAFNPHNMSAKQVVLHLILQMRKLRSREVKRQAQGHTEWLLTKELPSPYSKPTVPSMPQLVFADFLGRFKLGRYKSHREEGKKSITFCFLKQNITILILHSTWGVSSWTFVASRH